MTTFVNEYHGDEGPLDFFAMYGAGNNVVNVVQNPDGSGSVTIKIWKGTTDDEGEPDETIHLPGHES